MTDKKVLVGMSGGVDSSVTAKLLLEKGYSPEGITLWLTGEKKSFRKKADAAKKVCDKLGITHHTADMRDVFTHYVINYFIDSYKMGITPNPCVFCNIHIKFGTMIEWAEKNGFEKIATGHYARIRYDNELKRFVLYKSIDRKKDQTYFLYGLTQEQLSKVLMPLGDFRKDSIKNISKSLGYHIDKYKESQEICFIPDGKYREYISEKTGRSQDGWFIDKSGKKIKKHEGITCYTIGQRKGLGLAMGYPVYVTKINPVDNTVVIGKEADLYENQLQAKDVNRIKYENMKAGKYSVKIRYAKKESTAFVKTDKQQMDINFEKPQRAITPGQAVVVYENDDVVCGGIIVS